MGGSFLSPKAPPAPAPTAVIPPPPPPPPSDIDMSGSGGLADQLKMRSQGLTKVTSQAQIKPVDARSDLLLSIQKGIQLTKTTERKVAEAPAPVEAAPLSVAQILARRIAIQGTSSEEEESDDDWN